MKLISIATVAAVLMSSVAQAHTVNSDAEAASTLLMLVVASEQPGTAPRASRGDLSRSPEQIRRARLATRYKPHAATFRIAVQKSPM